MILGIYVPCGEEEEDAESDIDTENHLKVRRLLRLPGPPARPEAIEHEYAKDEDRSEEHTSELQSRLHLVCRLLLEKKKHKKHTDDFTRKKKAQVVRKII